MFVKGDILKATHRAINEGRHFIVYLEGNSDADFIGGMITHSEQYGNVNMEINHFEKVDANGVNYKVKYDKSYLVKAKLIKPYIWGPFTKVGCLTIDGKQFLNNTIEDLETESFESYLLRNNLIR